MPIEIAKNVRIRGCQRPYETGQTKGPERGGAAVRLIISGDSGWETALTGSWNTDLVSTYHTACSASSLESVVIFLALSIPSSYVPTQCRETLLCDRRLRVY